jgi:succinylglutamic semialdehyde dehydrogenase
MNTDLFINGAWKEGAGPLLTSLDPATDAIVWQGRAASARDVADAVAAARAAFPAWSRRPNAERIAIVQAYGEVVKARSHQLTQLIARETGKTRSDAAGEVAAMIGKIPISVRAQAERAGERSELTAFGEARLTHRAHGVMAVLGPFNFPGHLPNGHIVPALLAGDTVVFKPSEFTPGVAEAMVACWQEARLPAGVLNLVHGGHDAGGALLDHPGISGVLFTGSARTGCLIHAKFAGRPDVILALEMGGNNPLIVWPDADLEAAADIVVVSAFQSSGQRCSCARRLIVPSGDFGQAVTAAVARRLAGLVIGSWDSQPEPFMGPLIHAGAAAQSLSFQADLIARGGEVITPLTRRENGSFVTPGLIDMTRAGSAPDEELFAPLLQVYRVETFEDALLLANTTRFGLSGGLVSDDPRLWEMAKERLRVGILNWNRPTTGAAGSMPFGGPGLSGNGRPSAYYAADYCAYPVASQMSARAHRIDLPGMPT